MATTELITILTPVAVYLSTELVKWIVPKIPGYLIVAVLVPILALAVSWFASMVGFEGSYWMRVGYGMLAVFINELYRQLKQIKKSE